MIQSGTVANFKANCFSFCKSFESMYRRVGVHLFMYGCLPFCNFCGVLYSSFYWIWLCILKYIWIVKSINETEQEQGLECTVFYCSVCAVKWFSSIFFIYSRGFIVAHSSHGLNWVILIDSTLKVHQSFKRTIWLLAVKWYYIDKFYKRKHLHGFTAND